MRTDRAAPPDRTTTPRPRTAGGSPLRASTLIAPVAILAVGLWTSADYSDVVGARVVVLEVVATLVAIGSLLAARTPFARRGLALVSAFGVLTAAGDVYWVLSTRATDLSYALGETEPGVTVTVVVLRYLALGALIAHVLPARDRVPGWWTGRTAVAHVQAATTTAALVLLCTPVGGLIADGNSPAVFCVFDIVVTAVAVAAVVTALGSAVRPDRRELRLLVVTAAGVAGIAAGDTVTVLSQIRGWSLGGGLGLALAVASVTVLIVTFLHAAPATANASSALPPVPARTRSGPAVALSVLVQHVLPLLVAVVTTARLVADGGNGAVHQVGPATVGTAAAAVLASLLQVTLRARHAHRDEHDAAAADRDELTGAYSRRGFTSLVRRTLADGPGNGAGWSLALLDLDGFKAVNDTFGHHVGDRVLTTTARRAAGVLAGRGALARFGGDEFVALLSTGPAGTVTTNRLLEQLEEAITTPVPLDDDASVGVGVSIGVTDIACGAGVDDLAAALERADGLMYEHKHRDRRRGDR